MNYIQETEKVLYEIKQDIKTIQKYIQSIEDDNIYIDTLTVESIIENIIDRANDLYILTNLE